MAFFASRYLPHVSGMLTADYLCRDVASEVKLVLDAAGRLSPRLPNLQRQELGRWWNKNNERPCLIC